MVPANQAVFVQIVVQEPRTVLEDLPNGHEETISLPAG